MTKRILACLLALTMLLSMTPLRASAADAAPQDSGPRLTDPSGIPQDRNKSDLPRNASLSRNSQEDLPPELLTAPILEADTETIVALTPNTAAYFRFIPETTDLYTFYAISDEDTFGIIEDETEGFYDDDSGEGNNFSLTMLLTAGETYYLTACFYFASTSGSFSVFMEQTHQFTETVTTPASCTTEGLLSRVCDHCGLTETTVLPAGHTWVVGECTTCGEKFLVTGTCGDALTWTLDGKGNLTLSGTGSTGQYGGFDTFYNGMHVDIDESYFTAPPAPWSEYYADIRTLTLEPGITDIGYYTFWGLPELRQVIIPEGVTEIRYAAFAYCSSLESIVLPATLDRLEVCFEYCSSLAEVTFQGPIPRFTNQQALYPLPDGLTVYCHNSDGSWDWILDNWYLPYGTTLYNIDSSITPEEFAFSQREYTLQIGQTLLLATNADPYVQSQLTHWEISAPDILYLSSDGHATGLRPGTVQISLSSPDGVYQADCTVTVTGGQSPDSSFTALDGTGEDNRGMQNYIMWDAPKFSFLSQQGQVLERIQYISGTGVVLARYDSALELISEEILQPELPLFGGFFAGQDYNFLLYGQTNPTESSSTEVLRIVRYTKDWERLDHCSVFGANTTVPFDAGTADFAEQNGVLYLHTSHEMYTSSDGYNHQANMTFAIDQSTMSVVDQWYSVMNISYGYVSHSFSQRIRVNDRYIFRLDHGDAHPRTVVLTRAAVDGSLTSVRYLDLLKIQGRTGDNYTGVSLGGLELTATGCLVVGNSVDQSDHQTWHPQSVRNIFLAVADQELSSSRLIWLTDYTEDTDHFVSTPQLVPISDGLFLVLWEEQESAYTWDQAWTCAVLVNGDGETLTQTVKLDCRLSDCQPILTHGGLVSWFTCDDDHLRLNQLSWQQLLRDGSGVEEDLGHDYVAQVTEPTCTDQGYTTYTCTGCGDSYTDNYVEPLGHIPDEGEIIYEPTCVSSGTKRLTCQRCGDSWLEDVPPVEHQYTTQVTEPTCVAQGYTYYICQYCGDRRTDDYTDPLGHDLGDWEEGAPSNCVNPGYDVRRCSRCSFTEYRDLPLGDHSYEVIVITPKCTEGGYTLYRCYHCRHEYTGDNTEPLGHDFCDWYVVDEATEEAEGLEQRDCSRCRESETRSIPKAEHVHNYTAQVTAPTCTEAGYTTYTCRCGDQYVSDEVPALGHDFCDWYVVEEPTEEAEGLEQRDCSRCRKAETRSIPKAEHVHNYTARVTAPTCTEAGYTTYTCRCGEGYVSDEVPALGHDFCDWYVVDEPTEEAEGLEQRDCSRCRKAETRSIPKAEHVHNYTARVTAPTCTEAGYTTYTCRCGDQYVSDEVPALGHDYSGGSCNRCGAADPDYREPAENPFTDVKEGDFFYDSVLWAMEGGITAGTSPTTFSPNNVCTRAQVVTFLWRSQGCPAPESEENPFTDVAPGSYYYDAVLWAVEQGITAGTGNGLFSPDASCTRAQVVTFLWRTFGTPAPESEDNPFTDVTDDAYFYSPVLWAVEQEITAGTGHGLFSPNAPCTRAQVVTFLYRAAK